MTTKLETLEATRGLSAMIRRCVHIDWDTPNGKPDLTFLVDATPEMLQNEADQRRRKALDAARRAGEAVNELERLASKVREAGAATVGDLPDAVHEEEVWSGVPADEYRD